MRFIYYEQKYSFATHTSGSMDGPSCMDVREEGKKLGKMSAIEMCLTKKNLNRQDNAEKIDGKLSYRVSRNYCQISSFDLIQRIRQ